MKVDHYIQLRMTNILCHVMREALEIIVVMIREISSGRGRPKEMILDGLRCWHEGILTELIQTHQRLTVENLYHFDVARHMMMYICESTLHRVKDSLDFSRMPWVL